MPYCSAQICGLTRLFAALLVFITCSLSAASVQTAPKLVDNGWQYYWGDLPFADGWQFDTVNWEPTAEAANPEGRGDNQILWLKLQLPTAEWRNPYLFINSVDLTLQVFEQGKNIYQFGQIDAAGNSQFAGWPWHLVPISAAESTTLYFRIFSDYSHIGLSGQVLIGNQADLLANIYARGLPGLFFILVVFIVGILGMLLGYIKKEQGGALSIGVLSLTLALMMLAENELVQLYLNAPLFWRHIAIFTYFMLPGCLAWGVYLWFERDVSWVVPVIGGISLLFTSTVAGLILFSEFSVINLYPVFDLLFILLVFGLLLVCLQKMSRVGVREGVIAFGILALFISLLLDMLSAHGLIPWIGRMGQWGLIFFTFAMLAVYLIKDIRQQQRLQVLSNELEAEVESRTAELQASQQKLQFMARRDFLTGLLNRRAFMELASREVVNAIRYKRPLSLVLLDLDHFKNINDQYGHDTGDKVLKAVADVASSKSRQGDLVCRYGGEEFVLLLQDAELQSAQALTQRMQQAIREVSVRSGGGETVSVTGSFGLIHYNSYQSCEGLEQPDDPEQLLHYLLIRADKMMYQVKSTGRDALNCCVC